MPFYDARMNDFEKLRVLNQGTLTRTGLSVRTSTLSNRNSRRVTTRSIELTPTATRLLVPTELLFYRNTDTKKTIGVLLKQLTSLAHSPTSLKLEDLKASLKAFPWKASNRTVLISSLRCDHVDIQIHGDRERVDNQYGLRDNTITLPLKMFLSEKTIDRFYKRPVVKHREITTLKPKSSSYRGSTNMNHVVKDLISKKNDLSELSSL